MSDVAIQVENLSKRHRIGVRSRHVGIREVLGFYSNPFNLFRRRTQTAHILALSDLSFEVERGQVMGVIGRNGAGKSTLLKILARITRPTSGAAVLRGRVGCLLEVGTGFHPDLTGRENIYLNGAILGMRKREIDRKFDEIVAFSEIEKFLDTAAKHFSSGMYVRLAFAVAAHLECDILLIDEVLAVGDAAFQRKCLGKISDVARGGRTILFVSHNMAAVRRLSTRCIWLDQGKARAIGGTSEVVAAYEESLAGPSPSRDERPASGARFARWELLDGGDSQPNRLSRPGPVRLRIRVTVDRPTSSAAHRLAIWNQEHELVWAWSVDGLALGPGEHDFHYELPELPIRAGVYQLEATLIEGYSVLDVWECNPPLVVSSEAVEGAQGMLSIPCRFQVVQAGRQPPNPSPDQ